jgi:putative transposase
VVVEFIDAYKSRFGIVPICRVLCEHSWGIAPSSYYAYRSRPVSAIALHDEALLPEIVSVQTQRHGRGRYGARKVWIVLGREGVVVARCTVARLMREAGLVGVTRGSQRHTTRRDPSALRPPDPVDRQFLADAPNQLWVVDFTYVSTWQQTAYTALVIDVYSRRIVGWRCSSAMPTELPLDALEMALFTRTRAGEDISGVVHHSDAGSQLEFKGSSQHRLVEGTVGGRRGSLLAFSS